MINETNSDFYEMCINNNSAIILSASLIFVILFVSLLYIIFKMNSDEGRMQYQISTLIQRMEQIQSKTS